MPLATFLNHNAQPHHRPVATSTLNRDGSSTASPCHMVLPTLLVGCVAANASELLRKFRAMGIADVDVVDDMDTALRCVGERDYAIIVLHQDIASQAMTGLFVQVALAFHASDQPAILLVGPACGSTPDLSDVTRLDPDCDSASFSRAVRTAIAASGAQCKSSFYCRRAACSLKPRDQLRRT